MKCYTCKKDVVGKSKKSKKVFCNHKCYSVYKSKLWKENNPKYAGGQLEKSCVQCNSTFKSKRYGKKRTPKFCSHTCYSLWRSEKIRGKKHPNFKGEEGGRITRPIRWQKKYELWVNDILKRDVVCQHCGSSDKLQVHHIYHLSKMVKEYIQKNGSLDPQDETFYDRKNGKVLCVYCHRKVHKTKSDELLETPRGQSAAKPLVHQRKVQRLPEG